MRAEVMFVLIDGPLDHGYGHLDGYSIHKFPGGHFSPLNWHIEGVLLADLESWRRLGGHVELS